MNVIGLTGYAGSGKSTVASYLVEEHGYTRLSFAGPLKKMLRTLDPLVSSSFDDQCYRVSEILETHGETEAKVLFPEYRRLLQVLGTDCIRAVDENFWVKAAVAQMTDPEGKYVFDDVRFPNEAQVIKDLNSWGLWYVERPGIHPANSHSSEAHAGVMGERQRLHNHYDLNWLHREVDIALTIAFSDTAALA